MKNLQRIRQKLLVDNESDPLDYNVMRLSDTLSVDEAEVLAGRFKSASATYYILHDPEKLADKCITAWENFGINSF
jgi:hypothetical protein